MVRELHVLGIVATAFSKASSASAPSGWSHLRGSGLTPPRRVMLADAAPKEGRRLGAHSATIMTEHCAVAVRKPTDQPRGTPPVLVPILKDLRSICSRTDTTCVMHHYFTTREACVIPTHTCGIIGHS